MSSFSELLAAKKAEKASAPPEHEIVEVALGDALITLKFYELPSADWARITAQCPPDIKASLDRRYGYSLAAVAALAAPLCGVVVEGDVETKLQVNPELDEWADVFATISGAHRNAINDAIFKLNQWGPDTRVQALKKASAAGSAAKQDSPASSESPSADSEGGNRAARRRTTTPKAK